MAGRRFTILGSMPSIPLVEAHEPAPSALPGPSSFKAIVVQGEGLEWSNQGLGRLKSAIQKLLSFQGGYPISTFARILVISKHHLTPRTKRV